MNAPQQVRSRRSLILRLVIAVLPRSCTSVTCDANLGSAVDPNFSSILKNHHALMSETGRGGSRERSARRPRAGSPDEHLKHEPRADVLQHACPGPKTLRQTGRAGHVASPRYSG